MSEIQVIRRGISRLSQLGIDSDLELDAHKLKFTDILLRQLSGGPLIIRDSTDTYNRDLYLRNLVSYGYLNFPATPSSIYAANTDNAYLTFFARRNGAATYEVARLQGGVEEAFEFSKMKLTGELKANGKVISNALIADEVTSAPAAGATQAGRIIRVRSGVGVATSVQMCCLNSANAYEWVTLGTAT